MYHELKINRDNFCRIIITYELLEPTLLIFMISIFRIQEDYSINFEIYLTNIYK